MRDFAFSGSKSVSDTRYACAVSRGHLDHFSRGLSETVDMLFCIYHKQAESPAPSEEWGFCGLQQGHEARYDGVGQGMCVLRPQGLTRLNHVFKLSRGYFLFRPSQHIIS
jgi:hypothetical protein